jgi:hypothetical protein
MQQQHTYYPAAAYAVTPNNAATQAHYPPLAPDTVDDDHDSVISSAVRLSLLIVLAFVVVTLFPVETAILGRWAFLATDTSRLSYIALALRALSLAGIVVGTKHATSLVS